MIEDVDVIDRAMLDPEHAKNFACPWLVQEADGRVHQFDTEEAACAFQREWRIKHKLHPVTGHST